MGICKKRLNEWNGISHDTELLKELFQSNKIDTILEQWDCSLTPAEFARLRTVGGEKCDSCGKSRQELSRKLLDVCARCSKTYYCGKECQTKQWKAGHNKCCRKPGEFKPEDFVCLHGLDSTNPELNGDLEHIVGKDPKNKGCWNVRLMVQSRIISVASEKMMQLRPLK